MTATPCSTVRRSAGRLRPLATSLTLVALASLSGCAGVNRFFDGADVDYRQQSGRVADLAVPPDLTQLDSEAGFVRENTPIGTPAPVAGAAAAASVAPGKTAAAAPAVAVTPAVVGQASLQGDQGIQWVNTSLTPAQTWAVLRQFWSDAGYSLDVDQPAIGRMETAWKEQTTQVPETGIRGAIRRFFGSLYDSGLRDKFIVRVEPAGSGSNVYLSHKGLEEQGNNANTIRSDQFTWVPRPRDPRLENEYLRRVLVKLGGGSDANQAVAAVSSKEAAKAPVPVTLSSGQPGVNLRQAPATAWRMLGLAIDRSVWRMQARDEAQAIYRISPPQTEEKGFFGKLFSKEKAMDWPAGAEAVVRVAPGAAPGSSLVTVDASAANGAALTAAQRLVLLQSLFPADDE